MDLGQDKQGNTQEAALDSTPSAGRAGEPGGGGGGGGVSGYQRDHALFNGDAQPAGDAEELEPPTILDLDLRPGDRVRVTVEKIITSELRDDGRFLCSDGQQLGLTFLEGATVYLLARQPFATPAAGVGVGGEEVTSARMDPGDLFYHAADQTWWEARDGRLMRASHPTRALETGWRVEVEAELRKWASDAQTVMGRVSKFDADLYNMRKMALIDAADLVRDGVPHPGADAGEGRAE